MTSLYKSFYSLIFVVLLLGFSQHSLAGIITVTNNGNSGAGSLADAITIANATPGADEIQFNLPAGQETISLTSPLPFITEAVFINGYSQPGATAGPIGTRTIIVNIDGAGMTADPTASAFVIDAAGDGTSIAGVAMYNFFYYAINLLTTVDNVHIWGNYIGTNSTGTATGLGNGGGILSNYSNFPPFNVNTNITIGVADDGVNDADEGNLIVSSTARLGFGQTGWGIVYWFTTNSTIAGNIIGLDKNGAIGGMGNALDGIFLTVNSSANFIGTDGDGNSDALEGNLVSDNGNFGILVAYNSHNNIVAGNKTGLDAGDNAAGNTTYGIGIWNCNGTRVGTNGDGISDNLEANIVGANGFGGIGLLSLDFGGFNDPTDNNTIAGNIVGTDATLTLDRGNSGAGIFIKAGTAGMSNSNNIIGSNNDGVGDDVEGNIITNNDTGITVIMDVAGAIITGNKISRNSIFLNATLGIDINQDGVSVNDDGDADAGPNDLFNAPVIQSTQIVGSDLVITGFSRPNSVIEFYIADAGPNPNPLPGGFTRSFGEGNTFLIRAQDDATLGTVTDDDLTTGNYDGALEGTGAGGTRTENAFSFTIPLSSLATTVSSGTRITALAYENASGAGNTSEFSGAVSASSLPVTLTSFKGRLNGDKAELSWTTTDEHNNSHFDIERSDNGQAYTTVGSVQGAGGITNTYHFTDNGPLAAVNYYRLKQVDIDGKSTYSRILVLRSDIGAITAKAAPSVFTSFINLSYKLQKEERISIRLIDMNGRILKTWYTRGDAGVNTFNLDGLDKLARGIYTLELTGETVSFRQQVLKQ
jgi:hypothetical protein